MQQIRENRLFQNAFLLIFLLTACSKKGAWQYNETVTKWPKYNSANLHCVSTDAFSGIEVEILKGEFGTLCFLNVASREIPTLSSDPKRTAVTIEIENQNYAYQAIVMECGQRILLPQEAFEKLLCGLCQNHNINIYLKGFKTKLTSENFSEYYKKMEKIPL